MKKFKIFILILVVLFGGFNFTHAQTVAPIEITMTATPAYVAPGGSATITWLAKNVTGSCFASGDNDSGTWTGEQQKSGSFSTGSLAKRGTEAYEYRSYNLRCSASGWNEGVVEATAVVGVGFPYGVTSTSEGTFPVVTMSLTPPVVSDGASTVLRWNVTSTSSSSCSTVGRWQYNGQIPNSGTQTIGPLDISSSPVTVGLRCENTKGRIETIISALVITPTSSTPTISRITSDTTPSPGDTVTISGTNFNTNTTVVLTDNSGKALVPTKTTIKPIIISSTSLSFVPLKDVNGYEFIPGPYSLQVQNGTLLSNSISFNIVSLFDNTKLNLLYPQGYVTWKIGSTQTIKWETERIPSTAKGKIVLSGTNIGGKNWTVVDNILNTGNYLWKSVGTVADGSIIPASSSAYSINVFMNGPSGIVTNFPLGFRLITLANSDGTIPNTIPIAYCVPNTNGMTSEKQLGCVPLPTPLPVECLGGPGATNNCPPVITHEGCSEGNIYNTQTGQLCNNNTTDNTNNNQTSEVSSFYNFGDKTLKIGSTGDAVKELQRFLNDKLNIDLVVDGKLGKKTIKVVMQWQNDNGLTADGLFGVKSRKKANEN
ncbi:MAG: peptidoglycan-binding domain-containing protein [Candidatus Paceibacterota bacterium]|jgi:hypothetical protein